MDIDQLIERGQKLLGTPIYTPKYKMWANDVKAFVAPHGPDIARMAEHSLNIHSAIIGGGTPPCNEQVNETIELLEELRDRPAERSRAQSDLINQRHAEAAKSIKEKLPHMTVNGGIVTLGDNSPVTTLTIGELTSAIISEVEALPDSPDKKTILEHLRGVLANPTFASVAPVVVGEAIKRILGGGN